MPSLENRKLSLGCSTNIDSIICRSGSIHTGIPLLLDAAGGGLSPPAFAARVRQLAGGIRRLGVESGSVVGLLALNSIAYAETICATICAGLISAPLNLRWSLPELDYAVNDAGIEILVVDGTFLDLARKLLAQNRIVRHLVLIGDGEGGADVTPYEDLFAEKAPLDLERDSATPCLISYTGGTTGFPKGVVHSHSSLVASAMNMAAASIPSKNRTYLIGVPLFHVSGFAFLFARLLQLDPMVIIPQFRPDVVARVVRDLGVEEMGLVPTMLQMLVADPAFDPADYASLRHIYYGASPISQALLGQVAAAFQGVDLTQVYGMTEVGVITSLGPQFHAGPLARANACGQPLAFTRVQIETEDGRECDEGEVGELVHYGASLMLYYHNKPEETRQAFRNGGLRSGDIGFRDAMGVITLCDRAKDMIISGGENVYSTEVENAVASHPDVGQVAVIGIPDERFGEAVHAVIVPLPGRVPTFESIRSHSHERLAGYKCPRSIELVDHLPVSAMNKILKTVLRDNYLAGQAAALTKEETK